VVQDRFTLQLARTFEVMGLFVVVFFGNLILTWALEAPGPDKPAGPGGMGLERGPGRGKQPDAAKQAG
jgi:hypothetical protein